MRSSGMPRSRASSPAVPWTEWHRPTWRVAGKRPAMAPVLIGTGLAERSRSAARLPGGALDRVAQAGLADGGEAFRDGPGVDRHGVDVLEQDRVGADLRHVLAKRPEMRDGPQAAHDA